MRRLEVVQHLKRLVGLAVDHLHRAGEPARQQHEVAFGGGAHRIFEHGAVRMHARRLAHGTAVAVDCAIGEHVGDVDRVPAAVGDHADAAGQR